LEVSGAVRDIYMTLVGYGVIFLHNIHLVVISILYPVEALWVWPQFYGYQMCCCDSTRILLAALWCLVLILVLFIWLAYGCWQCIASRTIATNQHIQSVSSYAIKCIWSDVPSSFAIFQTIELMCTRNVKIYAAATTIFV
jgi:hypothetical protein